MSLLKLDLYLANICSARLYLSCFRNTSLEAFVTASLISLHFFSFCALLTQSDLLSSNFVFAAFKAACASSNAARVARFAAIAASSLVWSIIVFLSFLAILALLSLTSCSNVNDGIENPLDSKCCFTCALVRAASFASATACFISVSAACFFISALISCSALSFKLFNSERTFFGKLAIPLFASFNAGFFSNPGTSILRPFNKASNILPISAFDSADTKANIAVFFLLSWNFLLPPTTLITRERYLLSTASVALVTLIFFNLSVGSPEITASNNNAFCASSTWRSFNNLFASATLFSSSLDLSRALSVFSISSFVNGTGTFFLLGCIVNGAATPPPSITCPARPVWVLS